MPLAANPDALRQVMRSRQVAVGARIRERRLEQGIGPTHFGALLGVGLQTVHKIETGEIVPRDHLKAAIALALEIELDELYPWPSTDELVDALHAGAAA